MSDNQKMANLLQQAENLEAKYQLEHTLLQHALQRETEMRYERDKALSLFARAVQAHGGSLCISAEALQDPSSAPRLHCTEDLLTREYVYTVIPEAPFVAPVCAAASTK